uniref:Ovule protein n=1 Tax=Caenorhabditis tropicalis TaxID=1561998 RepID=A0A1I7TBR1_9PELO
MLPSENSAEEKEKEAVTNCLHQSDFFPICISLFTVGIAMVRFLVRSERSLNSRVTRRLRPFEPFKSHMFSFQYLYMIPDDVKTDPEEESHQK